MQLSKAFLAIAAVASYFPSLSNGEEDAALCESMLREHAECNNRFYICNETYESCADDVASPQQVDAATNATNVTDFCETLVCLDNGTFYSLEDDTQPPSLEDDSATNGTSTGGSNNTASLEDDTDNPANGTASMEDDTPSGGSNSGGSSGGSSANSNKTSQAPAATAFGMVATAVFAIAAGLSLIV